MHTLKVECPVDSCEMIRAPISPDCATALATTMPAGQSSILATTPFALEANHDQLPNTGYINEFILPFFNALACIRFESVGTFLNVVNGSFKTA